MVTRELAAQIAANYAPNAESAEEVIKLLNDTYTTLNKMGEGEVVSAPDLESATGENGPAMEPVTSPQKAIGKDAINCLVCGKPFKTLKRHLKTAHDMTPQQYREAFGLSSDYPLVAENYSKERAKVAKDRGLGERLAEARRQQRKGKGS